MFAILNYKAAEPPKWRLCGEKKRIFVARVLPPLPLHRLQYIAQLQNNQHKFVKKQ